MPWVKFSDDWYDDRDLIEAGPLAMLAWPVLISWCARNLTNGELPAGQVRRLVDWHALGIEPESAIAPLIEKGRLQEIAGGYQIVNYLKYQPSREQVLAEREASRQRAAKSRERAAHVREECDDGAVPPVPVPDPVPDKSSSSSSSSDSVPPEVWTLAAKKKSEKPGAKVGDFRTWSKTVIKNDKADHGEDAAWIWSTYEITHDQLAGIIATGDRRILNSIRKREDPAA